MSAKYDNDFWDCFWSDYPEVEFDDEKKKRRRKINFMSVNFKNTNMKKFHVEKE